MYYLKPGDNENTDWNEKFIVKAQKSEKEVELGKKKKKKGSKIELAKRRGEFQPH